MVVMKLVLAGRN